MAKSSQKTQKTLRAKSETIKLRKHFNWPRRVPKEEWWQDLAAQVRNYPEGEQRPWGIPFEMASGSGSRVVMVAKDTPDVTILLGAPATFVCFLHTWNQIPTTVRMEDPAEGLVVGEYVLMYGDGTQHIQPVRGRFEVAMAESPGPPWLAMPFNMWEAVDPVNPPSGMRWGQAQPGLRNANGVPLVYAMPNPHPEQKIRSLVIRGVQESPLLVAGLTLYKGSAHPLAHLPRRTYRAVSYTHLRAHET